MWPAGMRARSQGKYNYGLALCRRTFLEMEVVITGVGSSLLCLFSAAALNLSAPRATSTLQCPSMGPSLPYDLISIITAQLRARDSRYYLIDQR